MSDQSHDHRSETDLPVIGRAKMKVVHRWLLGISLSGLMVAALIAAITDQGWQRFQLAYLVSFAYVLSLSLGSLFFVIVQHLTRAGWSVLIRRPAEILAANIVSVVLLFAPIIVFVSLSDSSLYSWRHNPSDTEHGVHPTSSSNDELTVEDESVVETESHVREHATDHHDTAIGSEKRAYLNAPAFFVRWAVLFFVWTALGLFFWRTSIRQDTDGDPKATTRMENMAGPAAILLALSITVAAIDLLMSLEPNWYSTIFGVYFFAGSVVGALSMMLIVVLILRRYHLMSAQMGDEHIVDLGRLLFAFVFFWAYIAFSQYMLLWYANVPETTGWLVARGASTATGYTNSWSLLLLLLLFGNFVLPFLGLMSRHAKKNSRVMMAWCVWLMLMHYADLFWLVMPVASQDLHVSLIDPCVFVSVCALYCLGGLRLAKVASLVPTGDPRFVESAKLADVY